MVTCYLIPCLSFTALQKKPKDLNVKASDMWSFAVTLWEMATREVPFADLSPMEAGMKVKIAHVFCVSLFFFPFIFIGEILLRSLLCIFQAIIDIIRNNLLKRYIA